MAQSHPRPDLRVRSIAEKMPLNLLLVLLSQPEDRVGMLRSFVFAHWGGRDDEASREATVRWLEASRLRLLRQAVVAMDAFRSEAQQRDRRVDLAVGEILRAFAGEE